MMVHEISTFLSENEWIAELAKIVVTLLLTGIIVPIVKNTFAKANEKRELRQKRAEMKNSLINAEQAAIAKYSSGFGGGRSGGRAAAQIYAAHIQWFCGRYGF